MIEVLFEFGNEIILIVIRGNDIKFGTTAYGNQLANISGLKLNREGVIKEFPDLKDREDWKEKTIKRFKKKIKSFDTEEEKAQYLIDDLKKFGYKPTYKQRCGHRRVKLNE